MDKKFVTNTRILQWHGVK